jgi:hypothetical protein
MPIAPRSGPPPILSTEGPQRQLTQQASPEMWGRLVAEVFALPGVVEGISGVSPVTSRAVFVVGLEKAAAPETSLYPEGRLEPVHLHGVHDTSIHLTLPIARGAELVELGWARPHEYADYGTEFLVYGPRDSDELAVVLGIVEESLGYARGA